MSIPYPSATVPPPPTVHSPMRQSRRRWGSGRSRCSAPSAPTVSATFEFQLFYGKSLIYDVNNSREFMFHLLNNIDGSAIIQETNCLRASNLSGPFKQTRHYTINMSLSTLGMNLAKFILIPPNEPFYSYPIWGLIVNPSYLWLESDEFILAGCVRLGYHGDYVHALRQLAKSEQVQRLQTANCA